MGFKFSKRLTSKQKEEVQRALLNFHIENTKVEVYNRQIRKEKRDARLYIKEMKSREIKLTKDERQHIKNILSQKLQKSIPGKSLIRELRDRNLSYSESNMYYDIRRSGAFAIAKTPESRQRAINWFDNYFEKLRQEKGLTARQAYKVWEKAKKQSYDNMTSSELEFALELREQGSP